MQSLLTPYIANDMMRKKLAGGLTNMDKSAILRQTDRQTDRQNLYILICLMTDPIADGHSDRVFCMRQQVSGSMRIY